MSSTQPALVLRKYDFSETSQILRLFARDSGVVGVLARGSRRPKSAFGGALDLFYLGTARVIPRPRSGLDLLASFRVEQANRELAAAPGRFSAACHLAELVLGFTREDEPLPRLYEIVVGAIDRLGGAGPQEIPSLLAGAELAALRELGFAPSLSCCASCGRAVTRGPASLSVSQGGVLCSDCRSQDPDAQDAAPGLLGTLRTLSRTAPDRAARIRASKRDAREIRRFLTRFEEWRLERRLRAARFL